jgi:hypothetical protein
MNANGYKCTFNVCEQFQGTILIMMNDPMRKLISEVIHEFDDDLEPQVRAFGLALYNPRKSTELRRQKLEASDRDYGQPILYMKPTFNVCEPFLGVTITQMNDSMRRLLSQVIHEMEEPVEREIRAFGLALYDPRKSTELRRQKFEAQAV